MYLRRHTPAKERKKKKKKKKKEKTFSSFDARYHFALERESSGGDGG